MTVSAPPNDPVVEVRIGSYVNSVKQARLFTDTPLVMEGGGRLSPVHIAYETWGQLNDAADNAVLLIHALTGDSHASSLHGGPPGWFEGVIGPGAALDPEKFFIVCTNWLGSNYGSTGPASLNPETGSPYGTDFPRVTIGDMSRAQKALSEHLGIGQWHAVMGGSVGGMVTLDFAARFPGMTARAVPIATSFRASPWVIAFHEIMRRIIALGHDSGDDELLRRALEVARMVGIATYRSREEFVSRYQRARAELSWQDEGCIFAVESYLRHQGKKLDERFDPITYAYLTKAADMFDLGETHGTLDQALSRIRCQVLTVGINSDYLFPLNEQEEIADEMTRAGIDARLEVIDSENGHDGFLIEFEQLNRMLDRFMGSDPHTKDLVQMKTIRIGLLGCGKVGSAFCRLLKEKGALYEKRDGLTFELAAIGVKHPDKAREAWVDKGLIREGWQKVLAEPDIDVVVELIGGGDDARNAVFEALNRGLHTVTANKVLLSSDGAALTSLAREKKRGLCFEAAVGSGTPIIGALADTLSANRFEKLIGIVNGTTNYILSKMTDSRLPYQEALDNAIDRGFSEADPRFDVEGKDAAQKLSILAALAFGVEVPPEEIYTEGISRVTNADIDLVAGFGYVIKLLAVGKRTPNGVELRVHPALVSARHPLASVRNELNAFLLQGDVSGDVMLHGKGAGPDTTAGAVLSDVARLSHFEATPWLARDWKYDNLEHLPIGDVETGYHLIFPVLNKPGIIGRLTSTLGSYGINIDSAHAHIPDEKDERGLVQILSHRAKERDVRAALKAIQDLELLTEEARFYRVAVLAER